MRGQCPCTLLPSSPSRVSQSKALGIRTLSLTVFTTVLIFNHALIDVGSLIHETRTNEI